MKIRDLFRSSRNSSRLASSHDESIAAAAFESCGFIPISQVQPADIFVVGFPKSGNTWMQNLIAGLLYGMDTRYLPDALTQILVPNVHGCKFYKRIGNFTCFKSHFLPRPEYRRVVYLVRDGRDAMVSYFHMNNAVLDTPVSWEEMVGSGKSVFPCKWHDHVQQWIDNPFDAEMIFIRYEDLHRQPTSELEKFCEFAGLDRANSILDRSIAGNQFSQMQVKEVLFGWDNNDWNTNEKFVRRGQVGSFHQEMPKQLARIFEQESHEQLRKFDYPILP